MKLSFIIDFLVVQYIIHCSWLKNLYEKIISESSMILKFGARFNKRFQTSHTKS